jgi:hypothetical protein
MNPNHPPTRRATPLLAAGVALALLLVAAAWTLTARGSGGDPAGDPAASAPPPASAPPTTLAATTTTQDPEAEVVARLRHILRVRDQALLSRNASLLDDVYTVDCNCLRDGRAAIRRLRQDKVIWKGLSTTLTVQETHRVNDRLWEVIGVLSSPAVRVQDEAGGLLRTVPPERNQLRFALAKPTDADEWLVGHVSLLNQGG